MSGVIPCHHKIISKGPQIERMKRIDWGRRFTPQNYKKINQKIIQNLTKIKKTHAALCVSPCMFVCADRTGNKRVCIKGNSLPEYDVSHCRRHRQ